MSAKHDAITAFVRDLWRDDRLPDRFWSKVKIMPNGCWQWTRALSGGYGSYSVNGNGRGAHRYAYLILVGPIAEGLELDHLCRNRACVNPDHLEPVTPRINNLRGETFAAKQARRTHCPAGHEYTPENTHVTSKGSRHCRKCQRVHSSKAHARAMSDPVKAAHRRELARERTRRYRERKRAASAAEAA